MANLSLSDLGQLYGQPPQQNADSIGNLGNGDLSPLTLMLEKQRLQQGPRAISREINPGPTWGGRDSNNLRPEDVMQSRFFPQFIQEKL